MDLILDKHVATHKIIVFDVDDNGSMQNVRIQYFSGTDEQARQRAIEFKKQRDIEEPLPDNETWGKIDYLYHVWTLDEFGNEDKLICENN